MTKHQGKYYQLISNTFLFALGNIGSKFLVFFLMPLYTNALTTTEYGISELVITGTNLLIPFVSVSIQDATLRFALDKEVNGGEVLKNSVVILAIGSILTCCLYPIIKLYEPTADWSLYFVAISIVYMVRNCFSVYIKAIGKPKLFAIDSILYTALLMATNILFLIVFHMELRGYFYAIIFSSFVSIITLTIFGNIYRSLTTCAINKKLMKEMIIFSLPMILNNVSWWIINSLDKVMIAYFISVGASGIYSVAAKIPSILTAIVSVFNQAWVISSVTEYDTTKDETFFSNTFEMFSGVMVVFSSFIVLIIKPFMNIYVGASFASSWQYVPILLIGSVFLSYATFFGAIYTSAKKNVSVMSTTFLAAGINISLNLILIPRFGIQGAVVATAVAYFVVFIFRMFNSRRYLQFYINYVKVGFSVMILICQCLFTIQDKNAFLTSMICIVLQLVINYKTVRKIIEMVKTVVVKIVGSFN